jgi:hypothetical protein
VFDKPIRPAAAFPNIITEPWENDTGRRLRVGECPNLRSQISILMLGLLQSLGVI